MERRRSSLTLAILIWGIIFSAFLGCKARKDYSSGSEVKAVDIKDANALLALCNQSQAGKLDQLTRLVFANSANRVKNDPSFKGGGCKGVAMGLANLKELRLHLPIGGDLTLLQHMKSLESLILSGGTKLKNFEMIRTLPLLKRLNVGDMAGDPQGKARILAVISTMKNLRELHLHSNGLTNINFVKTLPDLRQLNISQNQVRDISALIHTPNLESLNIDTNGISDISVLQNHIDLVNLTMSRNQVEDISPLLNCANLETLLASQNRVKTIQGIGSLSNLRQLHIGQNQVANITPIQQLGALEVLNLEKNNILNIEPLKGLTIRSLFLRDNPISDLSPIVSIKGVSGLNIERTRVEVLPDLTSLPIHTLSLGQTRIKNVCPGLPKTLKRLKLPNGQMLFDQNKVNSFRNQFCRK